MHLLEYHRDSAAEGYYKVDKGPVVVNSDILQESHIQLAAADHPDSLHTG